MSIKPHIMRFSGIYLQKNRGYSNNVRDAVLVSIIEMGKKGMLHEKIVKFIGRDRNIVSAICKELIKDSLIRVEKRGLLKIYYPTEKAYDLTELSKSDFFGQQLKSFLIPSRAFGFKMDWYELLKFNKKQDQYLQGLFGNYQLDPRYPFPFVVCREQNPEIQELESLAVKLQNFSLKIGATITYSLLRSMSPELINQISNQAKLTNRYSIDELIRKWIKNVFVSMDLLSEFQKIILEKEYPKSLADKSKKSIYQLDQKIIDDSFHILYRLYPRIIDRIEKIFNNLEKDMKKEDDSWKMVICDHAFVSTIKKGKQKIPDEYNDQYNSINYKYEYSTEKGIQTFHCKKCDRKVIQNLDYKITDSVLVKKLNSLVEIQNKKRLEESSKNKSRKSKNYKNRKLQITDILGPSPYVYKCKENKHVFVRGSKSDCIFQYKIGLYESYNCILCYSLVQLYIIDEKTSEEIRNSIIEKVGADMFTLQVADSVLKKFCENRNQFYSSKDFEFSDGLKLHKKGYTIKEFRNDLDSIMNILHQYNIIKKDNSGYYKFNVERNINQ